MDWAGSGLATSGVSGVIWIVTSLGDTVGGGPGLGEMVGTTLATILVVDAINKLLLGEKDLRSSLDGVVSLNGLDGREGPA
jgi:hypothetical protein